MSSRKNPAKRGTAGGKRKAPPSNDDDDRETSKKKPSIQHGDIIDSMVEFVLNSEDGDIRQELNKSDAWKDEELAKALQERMLKKKEDAHAKLDMDAIGKLSGACVWVQVHLETLQERRPSKAITSSGRVAPVDLAIESSKLVFKNDLDRFSETVNDLFLWHDRDHKSHFAPYFPLVQSSGMGKTKLLYEYSQSQKDRPVFLILCTKKEADDAHKPSPSIFEHGLSVSIYTSTEENRNKIWGQLDSILGQVDEKEVVFLFDEASVLLRNDGFAFRCVRWWLKKKREHKHVVAVFAGTTSKLSNFFREPVPSGTSRDADQKMKGKGSELYPPFYEICTTGLPINVNLGNESGVVEDTGASSSEFDSAIPHGRPLFSVMKQTGDLTTDSMKAIMQRLTLSKDTLRPSVYFSILGTRAQLGQTTTSMSTELVAMGYANLVHYSPKEATVASIAFFPDPVCARLAMALMLPKHSFWTKFKQCSDFKMIAREWMEKAGELFSQGLCRLDKGDAGEIAVAFYMLFCGDELRSRLPNNDDLTTFSVSIESWFALMHEDGQEDGKNTRASGTSPTLPDDNGPTINFIQVCRNNLRFNVSELANEEMLRQWYESACAFYAYPLCPAFDLYAPVRYVKTSTAAEKGNVKNDMYRYCPMLVSVKNRVLYSPTQAEAAMSAMKDLLDKKNVKKAVCVVVWIGVAVDSGKSRSDGGSSLDWDSFCSKITSIMEIHIVVPPDDRFGVSTLATSPTSSGGERTEVYASNFAVRQAACALSKSKKGDGKPHQLLRSKSQVQSFFKGLWDDYKKVH